MSADILRRKVVSALEEQILAYAGFCARRTGDSLDDIRLNQGVVRGLEVAIEHVNDLYNRLYD